MPFFDGDGVPLNRLGPTNLRLVPAAADDSCLVNLTWWESLVSTAGAAPTTPYPAGACRATWRR